MKVKLKKNILLSKLTTTKTGGPAKFFFEAKNEKNMAEVLKWTNANKIKWTVIGGGSNTLASDKGFDGLIIRNEITGFKAGNKIYLGAGNILAKSIKRLERMGLAGMENMIGIPGTVGGAVYGCSGSHGQEIKDCLVRVRYLDARDMGMKWLSKKQSKFSYRYSIFKKEKGWVILGAEFKLLKSRPEELAGKSEGIRKIRKKKKFHLPCPGSFFKNIVIKNIKPGGLRKNLLKKLGGNGVKQEKISAGYLLDQVGAKKHKVGHIKVNDRHANVFYNEGGGKTADILKLAKILKAKVKNKFGIELEEEVQFI